MLLIHIDILNQIWNFKVYIIIAYPFNAKMTMPTIFGCLTFLNIISFRVRFRTMFNINYGFRKYAGLLCPTWLEAY